MPTEFNKVKSGVTFTKAAQKQDLQSGDTIPEALGKLAKYMDVTDDALSNIQPILTFDSEPEYESLNPVTSGGLYDYIELQSPTYINTFSTESDLYNYSGNLTNNDYAFVGTGSGATYYMNVYQYKSEVTRDTIENIKTVPSGSNILKTLNEPALPSGNIQYKLDCYVTAVNNQSYGTSPVINVIFSDNTTAQVTVPNANKTHIVKTYSKTIKAIQFMNSGQASDGYTDFEDIQILTTAGWNKLSYRLYNPTWEANQLSAINSGITSTKVNNYDNHIANKLNPHEVTKSQVGLGNVGNFKAVSTEASQGLTTTEQSNARTNINAQESLSFNGTYNASTNKVATESTVTNAINALDVTSQGGAGKYISEISETDGKISATPTTMDTSLSNSSTNNNCPTSKTVYDDQQRQETEIGVVANTGAKNFCPKETETSTDSGFTSDVPVNIPAGTYILSFTGTLAYTASLSLYRALPHSGNNLASINLSATTGAQSIEFTISEAAKYIAFYHNGSGNSLTNIMLRPASITDSTFQPYAKTNRELTVAEDEDRAALAEVIDGGAAGTKNLLDCSLQSIKAVTQYPAYGFSWNGNVCKSTRGASFTINADNSITVAATNVRNDVWFKLTDFMYSAGSYVISGCPTNGSTSSYYIESDAINYRDIGNGVSFTINSTTTDSIYIAVKTGQTFEKTFYPMLCPKVLYDADPSYVPYAPALTNIILTPAAIKAVDEGAKNIADMSKSSFTTLTKDSVTVTLSGDTITASGTGGTATNNFFNIFYVSNALLVPSGTWVISLAGTGIDNFRVEEYDNAHPDVVKGDFGQPLTVTVPDNATQSYIRITSKPSTNCAGTFKLMICTAADYAVSPKFVPYALPNPVITPALIEQVESGAKNLLRFDETSTDNNNVRFTVNADGSITATQIAARTATAVFRMRYTDNLLSQDVRGKILSGCPSGGSDSTYKINIERRTYPYKNYGRDAGNGLLIPDTIADDIPLYLYIQVYSSVTLPLTFKPMICTAADYAVSPKFVPYAPTNRELYEKCETKVTMRQIYDIPPVSIIPAEGETADLNDYVTPGTYLVSTSNLASRIINAPFTDKGYKIEVEQYRSGNYYKQTIFPWAEPGAFYIRARAGGATWSSWYKFEGTEVTS